MARVSTLAWDDWIHTISLTRDVDEEDEHCRDTTLKMVEAISALCRDWLSPLAVSMRFEARNPEDYYFPDSEHPPAEPSWLLRVREWDEQIDLRHHLRDPQERTVEVLGAAELLDCVTEATEQPLLPPRQIMMCECSVPALAVTLPEPIELEPRYVDSLVRVVSARRADRRWVIAGPRGPWAATLPLAVESSNSHGTSHVSLVIFWDFWLRHEAGRAQVRGAVERVLALGRGWKLTTDLPPPPKY